MPFRVCFVVKVKYLLSRNLNLVLLKSWLKHKIKIINYFLFHFLDFIAHIIEQFFCNNLQETNSFVQFP